MSFSGFHTEDHQPTSIPEVFFTQLLSKISHLGELKLTLYFFWRLERMEGDFRCLSLSALTADDHLTALLDDCPLLEAISLALTDNILLAAEFSGEPPETYYFLNTPKGRAAASAVQNGSWKPTLPAEMPVEFTTERPNIFRIYEQHIGPLSPMIAETLEEAEKTYPPEWIEEAVRQAVEYNKRSWRYIEAILRNWQEGGHRERQDRGDTEADRRRYAQWDTSSEG